MITLVFRFNDTQLKTTGKSGSGPSRSLESLGRAQNIFMPANITSRVTWKMMIGDVISFSFYTCLILFHVNK